MNFGLYIHVEIMKLHTCDAIGGGRDGDRAGRCATGGSDGGRAGRCSTGGRDGRCAGSLGGCRSS